MNNNKFESFDEFCLKLNEDGEKGFFGSLIDKTKSFVPRVMRFARAKSVMKSYLKGFEKKSVNLIHHFEKNIKKISETIDANYQKFKKDKLDALVALDKTDEAVQLAVNYKKELSSRKESELKKINTYIDKILDSYTSSIDKRIDSPGFILNVELSDKGKGKLKAKWVEISAIKKMEVDEKISQLLDNAGLGRIDEINASLDAFIEEHKFTYGKGALDFYVKSVEDLDGDHFKVEIFLRSPGHRHALSEKGLLLGDTEDQVDDVRSAKLIKAPNLHFSTYSMTILASREEYIRPYVKLVSSVNPRYGEAENIGVMVDDSIRNGLVAPRVRTGHATGMFDVDDTVEPKEDNED